MHIIKPLIKLIETRLNSALTLKEVASCAGYSERWLYSRFLTQTGLTLAQYIRRRKLTLAATLLRHTRRSVTDIAIMYGFSSLQSFSRAFHHHYKMSPSDYRYADIWDMHYAQPILFHSECIPSVRFTKIKNNVDNIMLSEEIPVRLNIDFSNSYNKEKEVYNNNLHQVIMFVLNQTREMKFFIIAGELLPGDETDSYLKYQITEAATQEEAERMIPDGTYSYLIFSGTDEDIATFQMYDSYSALCQGKCKIRRGAQYTLFQRQNNNTTADIRFMIPCIPQSQPDWGIKINKQSGDQKI
ncbi:AraC family transcriptional regulator [Salmonella enterica subsp. salamae]|nr:AraC family transcriptional regulator [Salmonella enterica subsp. salamae]